MSMIEKGLVASLKKANTAYRAGNPILTDAQYDAKLAQLKKLNPEHPYLKTVEVETLFNDKKAVHHPHPMLSTEKAYPPESDEKSDLQKWVDRCEKAHSELVSAGTVSDDLRYKITPKFDGVALRLYENGTLSTRGDGIKGSDVTHLLDLGLLVHGSIGKHAWVDGELVVPTEYFKNSLSAAFAHPRNVMAGLCGAKEYNKEQQELLASGNAHMLAYKDYEAIFATSQEVVNDAGDILKRIESETPYLIDGLIIEIVCEHTKEAMGATNHHHRWMVAYKENSEGVVTTVNHVVWQTGRTGIVAPVLDVQPVDVGGAVVSKVTGHNIEYLREHGLGIRSEIKIVRSGDVIPKHVATIKPTPVSDPDHCPSCGGPLVTDGPRFRCTNYECKAQLSGRIEHFFKTMGNCDGFGPSVCDLFVKADYMDVGDVFDWVDSNKAINGLGDKTSCNLRNEINRCRSEAVPDWQFLAALGIEGLGKGDSKKVLKHITLSDFITLSKEELRKALANIDGFGDIKVSKVLHYRDQSLLLVEYVYNEYSFNLTTTQPVADNAPLSGLSVVFTGKTPVPRAELTVLAEAAGATVQSSVSSKTDLLVYGGKLGATKQAAAEKHGTKTVPVDEFLQQIGND